MPYYQLPSLPQEASPSYEPRAGGAMNSLAYSPLSVQPLAFVREFLFLITVRSEFITDHQRLHEDGKSRMAEGFETHS